MTRFAKRLRTAQTRQPLVLVAAAKATLGSSSETMMTFLPHPNLWRGLMALDRTRLGKQRVEAFQIWCYLTGNHLEAIGGAEEQARALRYPAVRMWEGHTEVLKMYILVVCRVWALRGYSNLKMTQYIRTYGLDRIDHDRLAAQMPAWLCRSALRYRLMSSHRAMLWRRNRAHYHAFWADALINRERKYVWPLRLLCEMTPEERRRFDYVRSNQFAQDLQFAVTQYVPALAAVATAVPAISAAAIKQEPPAEGLAAAGWGYAIKEEPAGDWESVSAWDAATPRVTVPVKTEPRATVAVKREVGTTDHRPAGAGRYALRKRIKHET